VPATGGTPRQLTNGDWDHNGIEFTPDGKQILFTSLRVPMPTTSGANRKSIRSTSTAARSRN
jgi:hypothetical protein